MAGPFEALGDLIDEFLGKLSSAPEERWSSIVLFSGDRIVHTIDRPRKVAGDVDELVADAVAYARDTDVDGVVLAFTGERIFLAPGTYEKESDGVFRVFSPPDANTYRPCLVIWAESKHGSRIVSHDIDYYPRPLTTGSIEIVHEEHVDTDRDDPQGPRSPVLEPLRHAWAQAR